MDGDYFASDIVWLAVVIILVLIALCMFDHKNNMIILWYFTWHFYVLIITYVTRFEKRRLPHTQQQDTLFTIKRWLYSVHID